MRDRIRRMKEGLFAGDDRTVFWERMLALRRTVVPALPGCLTQGETIDEAITMAKEAISLHIEGLLAHGEQVPEEDEVVTVVVKVAA